jgi:PAS domain S-box-containing protein
MAQTRKTNAALAEENRRLRAQVAQLEDRLDHLAEHGTAAKALHESETLHRDVMNVVSDAVLIADDAGCLTYVSPNAHFIFGHAAEDIIRQGRIGFVLPGDLFDADVLEQCGEITNIECQIRDCVGRARNLLVTVRRVDRHGGTVLYVCRDVTERVQLMLDQKLLALTLQRRVEDRTRELRESCERYRRLVEGLQDDYLFYATDLDGTVTYISPSIHTILGYTPADVIGRNWREFIDSSDSAVTELEKLERMSFAGIPPPPFTAPVLHASGDIRILELRNLPVREVNGRVFANEGIGKNVTERLRAEEALRRAHEELEQRVRERTAALTAANDQLRESEQRYRSVVEDQLEFIIRWRGDGILTFANASYCHHRKASPDDLVGTSFITSIVEADRDALWQRLVAVSIDNPVQTHEHRVVLPDGRTAWQRWSHRALFNREGTVAEFQSVGYDVTEQRNREKRLRDRGNAVARLGALTERERNVMNLVVAGNANKVIARKLGLSIKTIEKHRSSLMKKLHIRSVPELVRMTMLVEPSGANG